MNAAHKHSGGWRLFIFAIMAMATGIAMQPAQAQNSGVYPPTDRPWNSVDYRALNDAISGGKAPLPTLSDPATSAVFTRMVAKDNTFFEIARTRSMPTGALFMEMGNTMTSLVPIMFAYLGEAAKGKPYERELAKLQVYMLALAGAAAVVADEYLPQIPKDDSYEQRMAGYKQMREGMRQMVTGVVMSVGETKFYSKDSTLEMAEGVVEHLPALQGALTDQDRAYLGSQVATQIDATTDSDVKAALQRLQAAIGKAN